MDKADLAELWQFPWPIMDVLIGGKSSIDLLELRVRSLSEATAFLKGYGFDPDDQVDLKRLDCIKIEALAFIERQLLQPREWARGVCPPRELIEAEDPRQLLIWASGKDPRERLLRAWACAVLRVMHTIAHLEGVNQKADLAEAREQIFGRIRQHLFRGKDGRVWLGNDDLKVELALVEWKDAKSRNSVLLKLLHKRDNVAETIYDTLGVRLIPRQVADVMMVVKVLRYFNIISYPNAYPARARNTLVDMDRFKSQIETLREMLASGSLSPEEFQTMVARLDPGPPPLPVSSNPHSAQAYKSIQMTGRQLIKVRNYRFEWLDKLKRAVDTPKLEPKVARILGELQGLVEGWHSVKSSRDVEVFFPFEIQILDLQSYEQAQSGEANHDRYKSSQVRAARKRILAKVLELSKAP